MISIITSKRSKVDSSNILEQLGKLDTQIQALETKQQQDVDDMRQMLAGGIAAIRTTSLPPMNGGVVADELSKFERNQARKHGPGDPRTSGDSLARIHRRGPEPWR